jgi:cytochrome P450
MLKKPMAWSGFEMPAGTNIALATSLVHEDETIYPDPDRFYPERWFDWKAKPHQFLPFGGGARRCLGAPLSILELKIVVSCWIRRFRFALPPNAAETELSTRRNITMAPASGVPLLIAGQF